MFLCGVVVILAVYNTQLKYLQCRLSGQLMYLWILIELVFNTRAHGGQRTKRMYYMNDSEFFIKTIDIFMR